MLMGSTFVWKFATDPDPDTHDTAGTIFLLLPSLTLVLIGIYCIASTLRYTVTLYSDAIEVTGLWQRRSLRREEIRGFEIALGILGLIPYDQKQKSLQISQIRLDAALGLWLSDFPDLGAAERHDSLSAILADPTLGATQAKRLQHLQRGRRLALAINIATSVICLWVFVAPRPYLLAILTLGLFPWIVPPLAALSRGVIQVDGKRNDVRPHIVIAFFLPGVVLGLRAALDIQIVGWQRPLALSVVGGLAMTVLTLLPYRSFRSWEMVLLLALPMTAYAYGAAMEANALLDRSPLKFSYAVVDSKDVSVNKVTTYHLRLNSVGPYPTPNDVTVSGALFRAVRPGDMVCIVSRAGFLDVPWYFVQQCRRS